MSLTAMNWAGHDRHGHKHFSISELLTPAESSATDHGLPHPSRYSNGHHYAPTTAYTHPPILTPPNRTPIGGTEYKFDPAGWDGTDHDGQRVDYMHPSQGYLPSPDAHSEYHTRLSQTHEEGFSEPSSIWYSPSGRLDYENLAGGATRSGPFRPGLQFTRCMSNRCKAESFPRCVSCTGYRNIVRASFFENQKADLPSLKFQTQWTRPLNMAYIKELKITVASVVLPTLKGEQEHLHKWEIIRRPRDSDVRANRGTCMNFSSPWMYRLCGLEACAGCFSKILELTQYQSGASESEIIALQAKRESHTHTNPVSLSCTRRNQHQHSDSPPMSRFDRVELEGATESMQRLLQGGTMTTGSVARPSVVPVAVNSDGIAGAPKLARGLAWERESPGGVVKAAGGSSDPAAPSARPLEAPLNMEDPRGIPSHSTKTYTTSELTGAESRKVCSQGMPLIVTGLGEKFETQWRLEHFRHGSGTCSIVECQTDANKLVTIGEFFRYHGEYEGRMNHWELKDWLVSTDFKAALPELYDEFPTRWNRHKDGGNRPSTHPSVIDLIFEHGTHTRGLGYSQSRSAFQRPPEKMDPTLSSWLKNMKKLSSLIDRLEDLASSAPVEHQSQLSSQVRRLRVTFKEQQERCIEFLQLSEEYADKYLSDISAEIQRQSSFLDLLEQRLDKANMLRQQAVYLRRLYESGTVTPMKHVCATALSRPLPSDFDLFSEVDFVLGQIQRCYVEMEKFWIEEIRRAAKALEKCRVDPSDVEYWKGVHASLKKAIEYWKAEPPRGDAPILRQNTAGASTEADIGTIASSLSSLLSLFEQKLKLIRSCATSIHVSFSGFSLVLKINLAFTKNRDQCLRFLRCCADYGEIIAAFRTPVWPMSSHVMESPNLRDRAMRPQFEATSVSAESATHIKGSREFETAYNQALILEEKAIFGLNTLLRNLLSWVVAMEGLPDDAASGATALQQLQELSHAWAKSRDSVREALVTLMSEPAQRLYYRSAPLASPRPQSGLRRWVMSLVTLAGFS